MLSRPLIITCLFCTFSLQAAVVLPFGANWRLLKGTAEASTPDNTSWRQPSFVDTGFTDAAAPFWYGDARPGGTLLSDMQGSYSCIFLRRSFTVNNAADVDVIKLSYFIDDGIVVWINGVEVRRENVAEGPVTIATLAANQPVDPAATVSVNLTGVSAYLVEGVNWITVQAFNTSLAASTDFGFDCSLETLTTETDAPTIVSKTPPPGPVTSLTEITVTFSEPVQGVSADDLLINTQPASTVFGNGTTYTFTFAQPLFGAVAISWFSGHGITDLAVIPNTFDGNAQSANWIYNLVDSLPPTVDTLFPPAGATVVSLSQVEVTFSEEVNGVNAGDLLINNVAATNVTRPPGGPYIFQFAAAAPGAIQVKWADGHGITDQSVAANAFAGGMWNYTVDPNAPPADLIINEIVASNVSGLQDEDAQEEDWIEIYNRGTTAVDLTAWSLSDDTGIPGLWTFPSRLLGPGQYLVVFASGKDRKPTGGANRMHTNFQLSRGGDFLGLYAPDSPRRLVSGFDPNYPDQRNDNSYGYDSGGNLRYFATPTPGAANGNSTVVGLCSGVHFSVQRGHYTQPFDLVLSTATPGGTIRYTLDGSEPVATSTIYLGSLRITSTTLIRAAVFKNNFLPSLPDTHTYFFNASAAVRSLPVLSIATSSTNLFGRTGIMGMAGGSRSGDGAFITNNPATDYHNPSAHGIAWERPVSAELIYPQDNSGFQIDCGIRVQGSDWQRPRTTLTSKFSWRLYFRSDYGSGKLDAPLFPLSSVQEFDQIVVRAGFNEQGNPFIRDEITRRLSHDMGEVASHGTFWNVFTNGVSAGYYNPCERVHEEMLQSHLGGGTEWDVVGPSFAVSSEGLGIIDGDRNDFNNLLNYVWGVQTATTMTNPAIYTEVGRRLDLVNFADYCLLNAFVAMGDWPANNWRAARERTSDGVWRFICWDAEWAFGIYELSLNRDSFAFAGTGTEDAGLNSTVNSEIARLYQRLRMNREFRLLCADRIQKHFFNGGALTTANITTRFNEMRTQLGGVIGTMDTEILTWASQRPGLVMGQLNTYGLFGYSNALYGVYANSNAPAFSQHGGRVPPGFSLNIGAALGGSIYYTIDGTDPRVKFTGAVSPNASLYTVPVPLNQSVHIKARTLLNNTNWSALNEASFDVGTRGVPLRITEIMYNPAGDSRYEYIELQNVGGSTLDLAGFVFDEGIDFTFITGTMLAPGARILLANSTDPNAFAVRYPGVAVFGYFGGNLANGGERLTLRDDQKRIVTTVDFSDITGWPGRADGLGNSLEIIDTYGDPDNPANWADSNQAGGTPGAANGAHPVPSIRLNEVMAENANAVTHLGTFPDWVEIYNAGGQDMDLEGYSLSNGGNAREYVFPDNSVVPSQGYLVVWCDTNMNSGLHSGFTLDGTGDNVFLYDPASNRVDAVSFGSQLGDKTLGRIGADWVLTEPTAGTANSAASVGLASSLTINEWMANPVAGQDDWIELHNKGTLPVALRGSYLATTTTVHQITSYSFLGAKGFLQLLADEGVGPRHLDFKLPAAGGTILLYDTTGGEIERITYTGAIEGLARGRLPDGAGTIVNFPGSASPGASNYVNNYTGAVLNEVLARNQSAVTNNGRVADYLELFNGAGTDFPLAGMSLSVGSPQPGEWIFPAGAAVPANGYLVIWCDDERAPSTAAGEYNTGEALDGESGGVYLFNSAGQLVNSVAYGLQVANLPIGLSGGQWRLLSAATPGAANAAVAALGSAGSLRINEWMANPASGSDWFELYSLTNKPVELSGLYLTDDASSAGQTNTVVAPLSFIGANGFAVFTADADTGAGADHVAFQIDGSGDLLRIYSGATIIDTVVFGTQQPDVSEGRWLDGTESIIPFPGSASPGANNHLQINTVWINEILTHTDGVFEDAVEFRNPTAQAVNIGGWFLSNTGESPKKYRVPDNTMIPANGYAVFYQGQFGNNGPDSFAFSSAHGDEIWLSAADSVGNLTGFRTSASFGAASNGVPFGRIVTSLGVEYAPLSARTFGVNNPSSLAQFRTGTGASNAPPLIGPVVINEVMYHPLEGTDGEEYIEIYNISASAVNLFDAAFTTNRWRLRGGVDFIFPMNQSLAAGAFALVVPFDPADTQARAAFRSRYGIGESIQIFGPYEGQLANGGDRIELVRPDIPQPIGAPDAGFVPFLLVDALEYSDGLPWPSSGIDGAGLSLQRRASLGYGNDPLSWLASNPTAGAANGSGVVAPPTITQNPQNVSTPEDSMPTFSVTGAGPGPLSYQWRHNGLNLAGATSRTLSIPFAQLYNAGQYDVVVANAGGTAVSAPATLVVSVALVLLVAPEDVSAVLGGNATLSVMARGTPPLSYQWRKERIPINGANGPSYTVQNAQLSDDADYDVVITDPSGSLVSPSAHVTVLSAPVIVLQPIGQTNYAGSTVTFSVETTGTLPMGYRWRKGGGTITNLVLNSHVSFLTLANIQAADAASYSVVVTNRVSFTPGVLSSTARLGVLALTDTDQDGLPNDYEMNNGLNANSSADALQDADQDGVSNLDEYRSGTNPQDPLSYLQVTSITASGHVNISFLAGANRTYGVQYRDGAGAWQILGGAAASTTSRMVTLVDVEPPLAGLRIYRLVTPGF